MMEKQGLRPIINDSNYKKICVYSSSNLSVPTAFSLEATR